MIARKIFFLSIFAFQSLCASPLAEQFKQVGYAEFCDKNHGWAAFDSLYDYFDKFVEFLEANPSWAHKLYSAKERFIRSKGRHSDSTNFFGLYDESKREGRSQISFYYSVDFDNYFGSLYPKSLEIPEILHFFTACRKIQQPYESLFDQAAAELGLERILSSQTGHSFILLKVVKYLGSYSPIRAHYDGSALSLFLDSTDNQSLLLSPYQSSFTVDDFSCPEREFPRLQNQNSILLIPGAFLTEFSIDPTPHVVAQSGSTRYATIAFAMRLNYTPQKIALSPLPKINR